VAVFRDVKPYSADVCEEHVAAMFRVGKEQQVTQKCCYLCTTLYGVTSQNTEIFKVISVQ
jgi:sulfur relay (sulfurtransferase) complex TusBCD TusD component (DsrE family)